MPNQAALARALAARRAPSPAAVEWHKNLVSTNDRLKELARRGAPEWSVVLADRQTGGRGREGRPWASPPGGLYLSVLLRPRSAHLGLLPLAAGIAVVDAAAEQGLRAELKWPNDVLVLDAAVGGRPDAASPAESPGRKLGGILAEAASGPEGPDWVVLGIGMNVAIADDALPTELRERMAWLAEGKAGAPDLAVVAAAVLARLRVWYDAIGSSPAAVVRAWRERAVAWWGQGVEVRTGRETLRGRLLDVDEEGALLLTTEEGRTHRLVSGEVLRVRRGV
jgi:BirA family biotin operon repressor/biotin-[acetyl-CoA-carboxylase] ligase